VASLAAGEIVPDGFTQAASDVPAGFTQAASDVPAGFTQAASDVPAERAAADGMPARDFAAGAAMRASGSSSSSSRHSPPRQLSRSITPETAACPKSEGRKCRITSAAVGSSSSSSRVGLMPSLPPRRRSAHSPAPPLPSSDDRFEAITSLTVAIASRASAITSSSGNTRRPSLHSTSVLDPHMCDLDVITSSPGAVMSSPGYVTRPSAGARSPKRPYGFASDNASSRRVHGAAAKAPAPLSMQHRVLKSYGVPNLAEIMASPTATARVLAHLRQVASYTGNV
jgi:hypothetical protein